MLGLLKLVLFLRSASQPNQCTYTSVVQNSSSIVNISEGLDEDDDEVLKILNEFLKTSDEASVSSNVHRNRLIFLYTKRRMLQPQIIGCLDIFVQKPFLTYIIRF